MEVTVVSDPSILTDPSCNEHLIFNSDGNEEEDVGKKQQ